MQPSPEMAVVEMSREKDLGAPAITEGCDEEGVYDAILDAYAQVEDGHGDGMTVGSQLVTRFTKVVKEVGEGCNTVARNGLLLVLAFLSA